jgi:hypothetical protein
MTPLPGLTVVDVLEGLRPGDTATRLAERLGQPRGPSGHPDVRAIVPLLNEAREQGLLLRETPTKGSGQHEVTLPAVWSFA